jgi:hypothetical protein
MIQRRTPADSLRYWADILDDPAIDGDLAVIAGLRRVADELESKLVPEVEVTYDRSLVHVEAPERPLEARRSGAKNLSDPLYQNAFISEARRSMGQPSVEDAQALLGETVTLIFNVDWRPATGKLTDVTTHPAGGGPSLILDGYRERIYPLNAIQEIRRGPAELHD